MKSNKLLKEEIRKSVDLPADVVKELERQGKERRMLVKPYMEWVLIEKTKDKK